MGFQVLSFYQIRELILQEVRNLTGISASDDSDAAIRADFGNETAKEAIESQKQYGAMIKQQEEQNKKAELQNILGQELVNKINTLIDVTSQNKPLPMSGSNFLDVVGHAVQTESNRHGGVPPLIARR